MALRRAEAAAERDLVVSFSEGYRQNGGIHRSRTYLLALGPRR
jgi:hypothetical protein